MEIARNFRSVPDLGPIDRGPLLAMITLNAISILPAFLTDHVPFPASLSLGVALVLTLRSGPRFAAYYVIVSTLFSLVIWLGRGGSLAGSTALTAFLSTACMQGIMLLLTPWLLGDRRRDLINASPSPIGVLRLFLIVIPLVTLAPAAAGLFLASALGGVDPVRVGVAAAIQGLAGCYATAPLAMALLRDESGRRCCSCNCERRWTILGMLALVALVGVAHHSILTSGQVLMQTLLALGSLSLLVFLAVLSGWLATAVGALVLAITTGTALVTSLAPLDASAAVSEVISTAGIAVSAEMGSVLPVIAISLVVASMTEIHHRAYRSLKDRDERLGGLLDDTATGLIRTDEAGRIVFANEAAITVIGVDPSVDERDEHHVHIETLVAPTSRRRLRRALRVVEKGRRFQCELEITMPDGSTRIHIALFSPVRDPGSADSVLITMLDIDARERRDRRIRRREAVRNRGAVETGELDRLTSLVMSDVNNLATALAGVASFARDTRSPAGLDEMLLTLESGCETAARHAARLRHAMPGTALSEEKTDVGRHLRDRIHRAVATGRIRLDRMDARTGTLAPVTGAFLDLLAEELIFDLEPDGPASHPIVSMSVRDDRTIGGEPAVEIEFASSTRRRRRSIAALTGGIGDRSSTELEVFGLATIAARIEEIRGTVDVGSEDGRTIVTIRIPIEIRNWNAA